MCGREWPWTDPDCRRCNPLPVHWAGEPGEGPTSLHGNGAASFERTSGDEDDVTCKLCLTLLARESNERYPDCPTHPHNWVDCPGDSIVDHDPKRPGVGLDRDVTLDAPGSTDSEPRP